MKSNKKEPASNEKKNQPATVRGHTKSQENHVEFSVVERKVAEIDIKSTSRRPVKKSVLSIGHPLPGLSDPTLTVQLHNSSSSPSDQQASTKKDTNSSSTTLSTFDTEVAEELLRRERQVEEEFWLSLAAEAEWAAAAEMDEKYWDDLLSKVEAAAISKDSTKKMPTEQYWDNLLTKIKSTSCGKVETEAVPSASAEEKEETPTPMPAPAPAPVAAKKMKSKADPKKGQKNTDQVSGKSKEKSQKKVSSSLAVLQDIIRELDSPSNNNIDTPIKATPEVIPKEKLPDKAAVGTSAAIANSTAALPLVVESATNTKTTPIDSIAPNRTVASESESFIQEHTQHSASSTLLQSPSTSIPSSPYTSISYPASSSSPSVSTDHKVSEDRAKIRLEKLKAVRRPPRSSGTPADKTGGVIIDDVGGNLPKAPAPAPEHKAIPTSINKFLPPPVEGKKTVTVSSGVTSGNTSSISSYGILKKNNAENAKVSSINQADVLPTVTNGSSQRAEKNVQIVEPELPPRSAPPEVVATDPTPVAESNAKTKPKIRRPESWKLLSDSNRALVKAGAEPVFNIGSVVASTNTPATSLTEKSVPPPVEISGKSFVSTMPPVKTSVDESSFEAMCAELNAELLEASEHGIISNHVEFVESQVAEAEIDESHLDFGIGLSDHGLGDSRRGMTNNSSRGMTDNSSRGMTDNSSRGLADNSSRGLADNSSRGMTDNSSRGMADNSSRGMADNSSRGLGIDISGRSRCEGDDTVNDIVRSRTIPDAPLTDMNAARASMAGELEEKFGESPSSAQLPSYEDLSLADILKDLDRVISSVSDAANDREERREKQLLPPKLGFNGNKDAEISSTKRNSIKKFGAQAPFSMEAHIAEVKQTIQRREQQLRAKEESQYNKKIDTKANIIQSKEAMPDVKVLPTPPVEVPPIVTRNEVQRQEAISNEMFLQREENEKNERKKLELLRLENDKAHARRREEIVRQELEELEQQQDKQRSMAREIARKKALEEAKARSKDRRQGHKLS